MDKLLEKEKTKLVSKSTKLSKKKSTNRRPSKSNNSIDPLFEKEKTKLVSKTKNLNILLFLIIILKK